MLAPTRCSVDLFQNYFEMGQIMRVDLTTKPYNLDAEGIKWVKDTIAGMSVEEKIGQLFINMGSERTGE